jgi:signal transduction histidine kinase
VGSSRFARRATALSAARDGAPALAGDEIASLLARVESAEAAQAELLSVVSHDLRNPLSVVLVGARLLQRQLPPDAPGRRSVEAIVRGADEINRLVQDLVDARRMDESRFEIERAPSPTEDVVAGALEIVAPMAAQKSIGLVQEIPAGLPLVLADARGLARALATFAGSAVRYTPAGGDVTIRAEPDGRSVRFSIIDTGPGMSGEDLATAFQRHRAGRRRPTQAGGVSSFVAKGIVEAHGGRVWLESELGHGCTVRFTVPAA